MVRNCIFQASAIRGRGLWVNWIGLNADERVGTTYLTVVMRGMLREGSLEVGCEGKCAGLRERALE